MATFALIHGGQPAFACCDNGPQPNANARRDWDRFARTGTSYIEAGSPWENPWVESYGSRMRGNCWPSSSSTPCSRLRPSSPTGGPSTTPPTSVRAGHAHAPTECLRTSGGVSSQAPPSNRRLPRSATDRSPVVAKESVMPESGVTIAATGVTAESYAGASHRIGDPARRPGRAERRARRDRITVGRHDRTHRR